MNLLQWKPEYSVGVPSVDHDHREMIELINELGAEMGDSPDAERVELYLGDIYAAISAHFALEERIMREAGFAEYLPHKEDHEALLDILREIMDGFVADPAAGNERLGSELSDWFSGHFSSYDARLHGELGV